MSDSNEPEKQDDVKPNGDIEPKQTEPDYKAKYEEAIGHSRDWEKRAKANKEAADELQQLKDAQKTAEQKQADRITELETKLTGYEQRDQLKTWATEVAKEDPALVPLLRGSTREELEEHFAQLQSLTKKPIPKAAPGGKSPDDRTKPTSAAEALRALRNG